MVNHGKEWGSGGEQKYVLRPLLSPCDYNLLWFRCVLLIGVTHEPDDPGSTCWQACPPWVGKGTSGCYVPICVRSGYGSPLLPEVVKPSARYWQKSDQSCKDTLVTLLIPFQAKGSSLLTVAMLWKLPLTEETCLIQGHVLFLRAWVSGDKCKGRRLSHSTTLWRAILISNPTSPSAWSCFLTVPTEHL